MSLRVKIVLKMMALLSCFALLGAFSILALETLRETNRETGREFAELQRIRSISIRLAVSRASLLAGGDAPQITEQLQRVIIDIQSYLNDMGSEAAAADGDDPADHEHDVQEREHAQLAVVEIKRAFALTSQHEALSTADMSELGKMLDRAVIEVDAVADTCAAFLHNVNSHTRSTVRTAQLAMVSLSVVVLIIAIVVGVSLYRTIVFPLRELCDGVREISVGHFKKRLPEKGDPEFQTVICEFNKMAGQLEEFYLELEKKVAIKSQELVRSERLASVGFLAAGVAHEIRNPLGIISGYAELSLKMLRSSAAFQHSTREGRILSVIRDEAFRCKKITEELLGLVQGGSEGRESVNIAQVFHDVVFLAEGLQVFRQRQPVVRSRVADSLCAMVNPMELKQVVLNLTLNALDSVEPGKGQIDLEARSVAGRVELSVRDNGCGIGPETIDHVFEPFFTTKRGRSAPGTGLGLSVSHAIISKYGGVLRAESSGAGKGSRFVIELPAAQG